MKYNVGDGFTFTNVFSPVFKNFTILSFRVDVQEYEVCYPDGRKITLPESFIDEELRLGYLVQTSKNNGKWRRVSDSMEITTPKEPFSVINSFVEREVACRHPNKYLNKVFTMQFYVCPDCKKEV